MSTSLTFITGTALAASIATLGATCAHAQIADPCIKNHYILTNPGECTFPAAPADSAGAKHWTAIGPDGANVVALAAGPRESAVVFAGTAGAGVLKSVDGGVSWRPANSGLPTLYAPAVAIDPVTPSTVYAGTDAGVFKSTDGALSWSAASMGLDGAPRVVVQAMEVAPGSPATLYAVTSLGIFKTVNAAASWASLRSQPPGQPQFITVAPTSPATLYVGVEGYVYRSADDGANWTAIFGPYGEANVAQALAVDPETPSRLYLATGTGLAISQDGGASWSHGFARTCDPEDDPACWGSVELPGVSVASLAIDPQSSATIYAAAVDGAVWQSGDYGEHWAIQTGFPLVSPYRVNVLRVSASAPGTVYAGDASGVLLSADRGQTWTRPRLGVAAVPTGGFDVDPFAPSTIYATAGRLAKTTDGGLHWTAASAGLPDKLFILHLLVDPGSTSTLFADGMALFESSNAGDSWKLAPTGLGQFSLVLAMGIAPSRPSTLYIGAIDSGVLKSTDGGASWVPRNDGLGANGRYVFTALIVDPTNADTVYASVPLGSQSTIFKSTDGADHWRQLSIAPPAGKFISAIAIDPATPSTLYAGFLQSTPGAGVYKSVDGGETWTTPQNLLPTTMVSALAVDPAKPGRVYAATLAGVFESDDGAMTWNPLNAGLSSSQINALWVDRTGARLRASTAAGLFEYRIDAPAPGTIAVIEYHNAEFDHYFMTADASEIASLDSGAVAGWARTGHQFNAFATRNGNSVPVCRFVSSAFAPRNSHFYTPDGGECALLQANTDWSLETGDAFDVDAPAADGTCSTGSIPVYRMYNNGQGGAPNHRFSTDIGVVDKMVAEGWALEGPTHEFVDMCSPP